MFTPSQSLGEQFPWTTLPRPADTGGERQIAILSLFAGMGTDRVALERLLAVHGSLTRLGPSWFVESDAALGAAVGQYWRQ